MHLLGSVASLSDPSTCVFYAVETTHGKPTARIVCAGAFEHTAPTLQRFFSTR